MCILLFLIYLIFSLQVQSFSFGDKVRILNNKHIVEKMQKGKGGWNDAMVEVSCYGILKSREMISCSIEMYRYPFVYFRQEYHSNCFLKSLETATFHIQKIFLNYVFTVLSCLRV